MPTAPPMPPERRQRRVPEPVVLAELAEVDLPLGLQPDDEEEERHQPLVHPLLQGVGDAVRADLDREVGLPEFVVAADRHVGPDQRRDDGADQHQRRAGLGAEEVAHGRRQIAGPGGAPAVRLGGLVSHRQPKYVRRVKLTISDPGRFALKNAVRAAIVVPAAFAIGLKVFELPQMALFGAFGSVGLLIFVDFGGTRRERFLAYLATLAVCSLTISLGTLCSHTTWLAVALMLLVGFGVLFAGVVDGYVAAASLVLILTFVIAAMVQADASAIPDRLAGWGVAGALSLVAIFGLWPSRPPDQLRRRGRGGARQAGGAAGGDGGDAGVRPGYARGRGATGAALGRSLRSDRRRPQRLRLAAAPPERGRRAHRGLRPAGRRPRLVRLARPRAARAGLGQRGLRQRARGGGSAGAGGAPSCGGAAARERSRGRGDRAGGPRTRP